MDTAPTLWTPNSTKTSVFSADIPTLSSRPKPAPSPICAAQPPPKAIGSLWTTAERSLRPQLWQPPVSLEGLWNPARSEQQQSAQSQKLLWSTKDAKRTTDSLPGPSRKMSAVAHDIPLNFESPGGARAELWNKPPPRSATQEQEEECKGWMMPVPPSKSQPQPQQQQPQQKHHQHQQAVRMVPGKTHPAVVVVVVVEGHAPEHPQTQARRPVLRPSRSSRTLRMLEAVPDKEPPQVKVRVAGRLWTAPAPVPAPSAPQPEIAAPPLWTRETAKRTTEATPERVVPAPRKPCTHLPRATGSLWDGARNVVVTRKGKLVVSANNGNRSSLWSPSEPTVRPTLQKSKSSLRVIPVVGAAPDVVETVVEVKVAGRLWTAPVPAAATATTTTTTTTAAATTATTATAAAAAAAAAVPAPASPLWTKEAAKRTTEATPERVVPAPRKTSFDLPKATGSLWARQNVVVKKGKVVVSGSLWAHEGAGQRPALRRSKSSLQVLAVEKAAEEEGRTIEVKVAGRLWTAPMPAPIPNHAPPPLWVPEAASRTTTAMPERGTVVPRKMSIDPPKATGSLWARQNVVVKKGKVVVSDSLWAREGAVQPPALRRSQSSLRVLAVEKAAEEEDRTIEVKVAGRLWTAPMPAPAPIAKDAPPLWVPEAASRTTTAVPERGVVAPRKMSMDLPKAVGLLWNQLPSQDIVVKKGKVVFPGCLWNHHRHHHESAAHRPALRKSKSSLRVLAAQTVDTPQEDVQKIEVKVAGRLWTASRSRSPPATPRVAAPESPLWTRGTASRTTTAEPERGIAVPRKMGIDLPKAAGSLWDGQNVVIKKGRVVVSPNNIGLWSQQQPVLKRPKSSRTLIVAEKENADKAPTVEVKVAGRLWIAEAPTPELPAHQQEPAIPAPPAQITPPAKIEPPPRTANEPPWSGREMVVRKGRVVVSAANLANHATESVQRPVLRKSKSSVTVVPVEKKKKEDDEEEEREHVKQVEIKVGGRLWTGRAPLLPTVEATAPQTPLWSRETAKRTTTAVPERVITAPRKMSVDLPKATGSLWENRNIVVKKGKVTVSSNPSLWGCPAAADQQAPALQRSKSSVTLIAMEGEEVVEMVEVKIAGRLWSARKPSSLPPDVPMSPLWTKEAAERTTAADPERPAIAPAPRKMSLDLPKAAGPLWDQDATRRVVVKKNKVVVVPGASLWNHHQPVERPALRKTNSSRTLTAAAAWQDEERHGELSVKVGGRILTARAPSPPPPPKEALWSPPPPPTVVTPPPEPSHTWSRHTAARTTSQPPVRGHIVKKPRNSHSITIASDNPWSRPQQPQVVRKSRSRIMLTAMADPETTTATTTTTTAKQQQFSVKVAGRILTAVPVDASLWKPSAPSSTAAIPRLSMLWDPATASRTTTAAPTRSIPVQRKNSAGLPKASGSLWEVAAVADDDDVPGPSRASTLSQPSEGELEGGDTHANTSINANANVGKVAAVGTRKRVVIGQQRRDRYYSIDEGPGVGARLPQELQGAFMETIRIRSLRRKLRRME